MGLNSETPPSDPAALVHVNALKRAMDVVTEQAHVSSASATRGWSARQRAGRGR